MVNLKNALFIRQFHREALIVLRHKQALVNAMLFFIMFAGFFPMSIPHSIATLRLISPGIIVFALTLAVFLASERFYQADIDCAWTEQWLVAKKSLMIYVYSKWLLHGLVIALGLLLSLPILALLYQFSYFEMLDLGIILLLALPTLLALCGLVNAFGSFGKERSILMLLILLPLLLPLIILTSSAIAACLLKQDIAAYLALLLALAISMQVILGFASAQLIKIGLEYAG